MLNTILNKYQVSQLCCYITIGAKGKGHHAMDFPNSMSFIPYKHVVRNETTCPWACSWKLPLAGSWIGSYLSKVELNVLLSLAMARNKPALKELNQIMHNNLLAHASEKVGAGPMKTKIPPGLTFLALWGFNPVKCDSGTVRIWFKGLRDAAKMAAVTEVVGIQQLQCLFHAAKSTWPGFSDIF